MLGSNAGQNLDHMSKITVKGIINTSHPRKNLPTQKFDKIQTQVYMKIGLCNNLEFGEKEAVAAFTTGDNSSGQPDLPKSKVKVPPSKKPPT